MKSRCISALVFGLVLCLPVEPDARRTRGILGQEAPEVWAAQWQNLDLGETTFDVHRYHGKVVYLFFFQSWCPGCHSRGFPTLQAIARHYAHDSDVKFAVVQTVFEGFGSNTSQQAWSTMKRLGLALPIGHDPGPRGHRSLTMERYRSGGTPWIVIIGPDGVVRFNGFNIKVDKAIGLINELMPKMSLPRR